MARIYLLTYRGRCVIVYDAQLGASAMKPRYIIEHEDDSGLHVIVYTKWEYAWHWYGRFARRANTKALRIIKRTKYVDELIADLGWEERAKPDLL